jgi:hypothetical protein
MCDELPTRTANDPTANPPDESTPESPGDVSPDRGIRAAAPPAVEPVPARSRDGVDPPDESASGPPAGETANSPGGETANSSGNDATDSPEPPVDCDAEDDTENDAEDDDEERLAYRLERLRLWRVLATLAVVVARLIRSL